MARQVQFNTIIVIEIDPVVKYTRSDRSYRQLDIALKWLRQSEKMLNKKKVFKYLEVFNAQYCTCITYMYIHVYCMFVYDVVLVQSALFNHIKNIPCYFLFLLMHTIFVMLRCMFYGDIFQKILNCRSKICTYVLKKNSYNDIFHLLIILQAFSYSRL